MKFRIIKLKPGLFKYVPQVQEKDHHGHGYWRSIDKVEIGYTWVSHMWCKHLTLRGAKKTLKQYQDFKKPEFKPFVEEVVYECTKD